MKTRIVHQTERWNSHLIACFGRARLIERADGRAELRNATSGELTEAKEWISLFRHDTILDLRRAS